MLQKFLFIGVGGSGGKTLRILRQELERRLEQAGYSGPFPRAWQMLHIDVPDVPDGNEPALPPQLPTGSYTGLAPRGLSYGNLDEMVTQRGVRVLEELAGWRPDPKMVTVTPTFGAGQYRAVGRMVTIGSLENVVRAVRSALGALRDIAVDAELDRIATALGVAPAPERPEPQAVVVSSIAGGAGSGAFLDICDVLRMVDPDSRWTGESIGVLYTPDVFSELPDAARGGVHANGLAAMSETLAAYWHSAGDDREQHALMAASGVAPAPVDRSGPRFPFLVGRSNDEIAFSDQNEAYRAVARSLAALVTSVQVQDAVRAYLFGNFAAANDTLPDSLGLSTKMEKPFTSLGYGSVSLGRDRFARYSSRRLARHAVDRLLRGHWNERVPQEQTPEAACDQVARDNLFAFEEECGLRELGPDHNQILDAIRGGAAAEARSARLSAERNALVQSVTQGKVALKSADVSRQILARLEERRPKFLAELDAEDSERALRWVRDVQSQVSGVVAQYIARIGLPATTRMLDLMIEQIERAIIPELRRDADATRNQYTGTVTQRVASQLQAFVSDTMQPDNPQIAKGAKEAIDTLWAEAEAGLQDRAARIVEDFVGSFLRPLRAAIDRAKDKLQTQTNDSPASPSEIADWSTGAVPLSYTPAQNEVLLEEVERYPSIFLDKMQATVGSSNEGEALSAALREVILGSSSIEGQRALRSSTNWVPRTETLRGNDPARSAAFETRLEVRDLLRRAQDWQRRPDTAFSMHVDASLADYLDPKTTTPSEHEERLRHFRSAFRQALNVSLPLVSVNSAMLNRVHQLSAPKYQRVMTGIPFPTGHPAREIVRELLLNDGVPSDQIDRVFDDGRQSRVEVSTFLATPYEPVVFSSLVQPIADERAHRQAGGDNAGFWRWRRTRPLTQFIPTSPDVRLDMVRGWFVGRMLGLIEVDRPRDRAVTIRLADGAIEPFPFPLLGPPVEVLTDLLPAVLESLPMALVEMTSRGDAAMRPYWRIRDLGRAVNGVDPEYSGLPEVLGDWVLDAKASGGATPPPDFAGKAEQSWEERLELIEAFIARFIVAYDEIASAQVDLAMLPRLGRAWELRHDLLRALAQLNRMAERTRSRSIGGLGGIG